MKQNKIVFITILVLLTTFIAFIKLQPAKAATHSTYYEGSGKVKLWLSTTNEHYDKGILKIDGKNGKMVYCLNEGRSYWDTFTYREYDALDYLTSTGWCGNRNQCQDLLTELALYDAYLKKNPNLNVRQRHYFGQVLIWNRLPIQFSKSQKRRDGEYWLDVWAKENANLFPNKGALTADGCWCDANKCTEKGKQCKQENEDFQNKIYNEAKSYYNKNKKNTKGTGTVYWDGKIAHQAVIDFGNQIRVDEPSGVETKCTNCESTDTNGSVILRDTASFSSIINSSSNSSSKLGVSPQEYFHKSGNVYCKEEYKVIFPNANDQITVASGRYFTLNKQGSKMYSTGVPNLKTVKIEKTRICQAKLTSGELQPTECGPVISTAQQRGLLNSKLESFRQRAKSASSGIAAGQTGEVSIIYNETYDGKYNPTKLKLIQNTNRMIESSKTDNASTSYSATICHWEYYTDPDGTSHKVKVCEEQSFSTLTQETFTVTQYYELPAGTYQFVNKNTDVAVLEANKARPTEHFQDMETSNLPISYNNKGDKNHTAAKIQFTYKLPENDTYSKMYKAKLGDCYKKIADPNSKYYVCDVKVCEEDETLNPDGTCSSDTPSMPKCEYLKGIYYGPNGEVLNSEAEYIAKCSSKVTDKGCMHVGNNYYGQNGELLKSDQFGTAEEKYLAQCKQAACTIKNGKYYGKDGHIVTAEQYKKDCPNGKVPECPFDCKYGCCPSWWEGSGMMCKDENGECPSLGGNIIIYRPIDLANPFPGQTNFGRATGANWCSWNTNTGKVNCTSILPSLVGKFNSPNQTVQKEILKNRATDGDTVYGKKPLYTFNLDASTIQAIRDYNKKQRSKGTDYDDFTLNCTNPNGCYSTFLRDSGVIEIDKNNSECLQISSIPTCANKEELKGGTLSE